MGYNIESVRNLFFSLTPPHPLQKKIVCFVCAQFNVSNNGLTWLDHVLPCYCKWLSRKKNNHKMLLTHTKTDQICHFMSNSFNAVYNEVDEKWWHIEVMLHCILHNPLIVQLLKLIYILNRLILILFNSYLTTYSLWSAMHEFSLLLNK